MSQNTKSRKTKTTSRRKTTTSVTKVQKPRVNREQQLRALFGPSKSDIPTESLTYIRKNPKRFIKKISDIYGKDSVIKWVKTK